LCCVKRNILYSQPVGRRTDTPKIKTELRLTQTLKLLKGGAAAEIGGLMPTIKPQSMLQ
jgi:hypothetical protein